jgi:uncharacterized protein
VLFIKEEFKMLYDQISENIKTAMKNKEKEKLEALRYLKSMLIENKTAKDPKPEIDIVIGLSKKLQDSLSTYPAGHPATQKIENEIKIIAHYLPAPLAEGEVMNLIQEIVTRLGQPVAGAVMKELSPLIKGRFDGKRANELVKEVLHS